MYEDADGITCGPGDAQVHAALLAQLDAIKSIPRGIIPPATPPAPKDWESVRTAQRAELRHLLSRASRR